MQNAEEFLGVLHYTDIIIIMNTHNISAMIFDMDGVIWRAETPIGKPDQIFSTLKSHGIKIAYATNNSTKTILSFQNKLEIMGIESTPDQVFTSAKATAQYLKNEHPLGGDVYVVGMTGLHETLESFGFTIGNQDCLAVVVGMDETLTYDKLREATLLIRQGVPFIGTNPDKTFPSPLGLVPGAGSMLAAIEAATDTAPIIIGKPKATMFLQALEYLEEAPENVLVIGDRLETDIAGGQAAGCKTALVLSGVSTKEQAEMWTPSIDFISSDLTSLIRDLNLHE